MERVRTLDTTYLHNGMILSTLGLSPHGFAFGLTPKGLIPMEIFVHPYISMILPTSSQCGTLVLYPTILPSNKGPSSLPSNHLQDSPLSTNQDSPLQCVGSTRLTWKHHLPRELALSQVNSSSPCWDQDTSMKNPEHTACLTELIHGSHRDITGAHHLRSTFQEFIHLANFGAWL